MRKRPQTIDLQPWAFHEGPRVLIEHRDPDAALEVAAAIRRTGCTVGICRGPDEGSDPPTRCPMHGLEPCVAVAGADVVVSALELDEEGRHVLEGIRTRYPETELVVAATARQSLDLEELLTGCTVVPVDARPEEIAATVRAVLNG
jgi:DNA-binding NarL/FixJ family response regulator